jgi:hypothetical protein
MPQLSATNHASRGALNQARERFEPDGRTGVEVQLPGTSGQVSSNQTPDSLGPGKSLTGVLSVKDIRAMRLALGTSTLKSSTSLGT